MVYPKRLIVSKHYLKYLNNLRSFKNNKIVLLEWNSKAGNSICNKNIVYVEINNLVQSRQQLLAENSLKNCFYIFKTAT